MKKHLCSRLLSLVLAAVMVLGLFPAVHAAPGNVSWKKSRVDVSWDKTDRLVKEELRTMDAHKPTDLVRVSIILEDAPTLQAGYATMGIGANAAARAYDRKLQKLQDTAAAAISAQALGGRKLDVVWNLTLAVNLISANVPYGSIDAIKTVDGVRDVVLENRYEAQTAAAPEMYSSAGMVGSPAVWQTGLTGAGTRVAIVDTGTDTDHQSFDNGAYLYALAQNAAQKGISVEDYTASLDLLDAAEIAAVLDNLNATERLGIENASDYYINEKLPFGANYVDYDLNITHDFDIQGSHGSHVAGIAAANRFIGEDGAYVSARESVFMNGVAPDAQIITLKVFGNADGPFDSDYFAAIEDAIWLGCDSVNLSLGSGYPGYSRSTKFQELLDFLTTTDTVVVMSAGNSGHWAEETASGYLYNDGVSFQTNGEPGSYTNSLAVASVENDGTVGKFIDVAGNLIVYTETDYKNRPLTILDTSADGSGTEYDYIFIDGLGKPEDYAGIDLTGKVVFCHRGELSFSEKGNNAAKLGAAAVVICNNADEPFGMDLTDYSYTAPCVSVMLRDGAAVKAASARQTTEDGSVYYTGTVTISSKLGATEYHSDYYTMSAFSSWGVPGSLELKPEITAPGGQIWSVNGVDPSGTAYELMSGTSMAAPQVTGMAALVTEYIREQGLEEKTGLSVRQLAQSLLMSTAVPMREAASGGGYYSILNQGAGLARVDLAVAAESWVEVLGQSDGKVKAELGDDPDRTGAYTVEFVIHNMKGEDMTYELSADLFTQDIFDGGNGAMYLNTWTRSLPAEVEFSSMGVSLGTIDSDFSCDLNGDGTTGTADADYLLEYLLGNADELHADGDLNGDGTVNTYDAHVLLTKRTGSYAIHIPANGSARVRVDMELTDEARAFLDENAPTGAYIESYIYAEPVADPEGVVGVTHSIPVLGYYGSWSEPSMYDVGSYVEYLAGAETRAPYLYNINNVRSNFVTVNYGDGSEYVFGGNPFVEEAEYLPQRNAFNNESGAMLQNLRFTQIRNADRAALALYNVSDGMELFFEELGSIDGAYYHTNLGSWQNTQERLGLGLDLAGIPEGTQLELSLISAPEYYTICDAEENVTDTAWQQLDEGAYLTTAFTIDNTAPELLDIRLGEDNTLHVTAKDNEYIAAVALLNQAGTSMLSAVPGNQTEKNTELAAELDLAGIFGEKFLLALCDYAENQNVYEITLELDNQRPYFTAVNITELNDQYAFDIMGMEADGSYQKVADTGDMGVVYAAEYVEGAVFAVNTDSELYVGMDDDLFSFKSLAKLEPAGEHEVVSICDLAYNKADGELYGLFYSDINDMAAPYLCTIDLYTGELEVLGVLPFDTNSLAIDGQGNFYSVAYDQSLLYTYGSDVGTTGEAAEVGTLDDRKSSVNTMAWDHNTDELYWICNGEELCELLKIDPRTAATELVSTFDFNATGLYIAYEPENDLFAPTDAVAAVMVEESADILAGTSVQLTARVLPWNISDDSVIWTTSDPSVATVDEFGMVTGVGAGSAVITAASVLDERKSASCTVNVTALNRELKGVIWDEEGQVWWSAFNTDTIPAYDKRSATDLLVNATLVAGDTLYASTLDTTNGVSDLYTVDPETYEMTLVGHSTAAYLDMAYAPNLGYGLAVYFNYIVVIDLETGDYLGAWDWTKGQYADLVGITYYGSEYNANYDAFMDFFLVLDADGNVYQEAFMPHSGGVASFYGPEDGFLRSIGAPVDYSYFQGFHYDGEYTYWTRFTEADDIVELIVWDCDVTDKVYSLGYFPDGVWPVGGLYTDGDFVGTNALIEEAMTTATVKTAELMTAIPVAELTGAKGGLNSVKTDSSASHNAADGQIEAAVTMPEDATNGIVTIAYDTGKLRSCGAAPTTDAMAYVDNGDGTITIAFADGSAVPAGEAVACALFRGITPVEDTTELTIRTTELNTGAAALEEKLAVRIPHLNCPSAHFKDVDQSQWYHAAVDFVVEKGWIKGLEDDLFGPNETMNRAQFVTILYRMEGKPAANNTHVFEDIPDGEYYTDAVYWALGSGITAGATEEKFEPYGKLSRSQLVSFMYRYARYKGYDLTADADLSGYEDADKIQDYAVKAWKWSVSHRIVSGYDADTLAPMDLTNRSQAAAIFQRFARSFMS